MKRRRFLKLSALSSSLSVGGSQVRSVDVSHTSLQSLAAFIDSADLADPQQVSQIRSAIENAVTTSQRELNSWGTSYDRLVAGISHRVDELLSIIPGVERPPPQPALEVEIDAINAAHSFYNTLLEFLETGETTSSSLLADEFAIYAGRVDPTLLGDIDAQLTAMEQQRQTLDEVLAAMYSSGSISTSLVPDYEQTLAGMNRLETVYATFGDLHRGLTETTQLLSAGTTSREMGEFTSAKQQFDVAMTQAAPSVNDALVSYALDANSLSLGRLQQILSVYHAGAVRFSASCEATERDARSQNAQFGEGIDHLLEARHLLQQSW
ncbi:hypothetical protein [Haloferax sp. Q22]|uniref:hypothetical protein n=1 Tax=Haloferax sp. (strain Q22) TaxID=1526048 RepID=UPI000737CF5A|nr:hypothetical protein [Haloferax sp. Q22]